MKAKSFTIQRQVYWAQRRGIPLFAASKQRAQGSEDHIGARGLHAYMRDYQSNLFEGLEPLVERSFVGGDGNELPNKMRAVHSSSALGVNFFHYWMKRNLLPELAKALKIPSPAIRQGSFEQRRRIMQEPDRNKFPKDPNIDFMFEYSHGRCLEVAVECKFTEPFGRRPGGLKQAYLDQPKLWNEIPQLLGLAQEICPKDNRFRYLHAAQLLKHILGLLHQVRSCRVCGKHEARLLYLFYDVAGEEGQQHREEVQQFQTIVLSQFPNKQPISFQFRTYQEALMELALKYRNGHQDYLDWMLERYL